MKARSCPRSRSTTEHELPVTAKVRATRRRQSLGLLALLSVAVPTAVAEERSPAEVFRRECEAEAQAASGSTILGRDGWHFYTDELSHIAAGPFWEPKDVARISPQAAEHGRSPLTAIVDLNDQLKDLDIVLIIAPAPLKAFVYPDKLSDRVPLQPGKPPPRLDGHQQEFYAVLRKHGVMVVDVVPDLLQHRLDREGQMFCKTDTHWTSIACVRVARKIATELRRMPWFEGVQKKEYGTAIGSREIAGDFHYLLPKGAKLPPETVPVRTVGIRTEKGLDPIAADILSPVVLMTDSYGKVFHTGGEDEHGTGAGLPDQLAAELGFPVDLLASSGSAIRSVRIALRRRVGKDPEYLSRKKIVIWCFASRYLSTVANEWSKVRISP